MSHRELSTREPSSNALSVPPRPVPGIDIRRLPLLPEEAFVWSRIDGRAALKEIAWSTGLEPQVVERALRRLVAVGAVAWSAASEPGASHPPRELTAPSSSPLCASVPPEPRLSQSPRARASSRPLATSPPASSARESAVGEQQQVAIRALYQRIQRADVDHYQLLGVSRSATKQEIKSAYFRLVADVHPDRYFGKELGELRLQLTEVFERLTAAHDTLTRSRKRAEYDTYLSAHETGSATSPPQGTAVEQPGASAGADPRHGHPATASALVSTIAKE